MNTTDKNTEGANPIDPFGDEASSTVSRTSGKQFGIAALFWVTFIVGLGIAYLQRLESPSIVINGFFALLIGVVAGGVIGLITRKMPDALFWSTLVAAFAYISTATDGSYAPAHRLAWAVVGALTAGIAATVWTGNKLLNAIACAIASGLVMGLFYLISSASARNIDLTLDAMLAPVIGVAVAVFVWLITWVESQQKMPRYITATWMLVAVIIGNLLSP